MAEHGNVFRRLSLKRLLGLLTQIAFDAPGISFSDFPVPFAPLLRSFTINHRYKSVSWEDLAELSKRFPSLEELYVKWLYVLDPTDNALNADIFPNLRRLHSSSADSWHDILIMARNVRELYLSADDAGCLLPRLSLNLTTVEATCGWDRCEWTADEWRTRFLVSLPRLEHLRMFEEFYQRSKSFSPLIDAFTQKHGPTGEIEVMCPSLKSLLLESVHVTSQSLLSFSSERIAWWRESELEVFPKRRLMIHCPLITLRRCDPLPNIEDATHEDLVKALGDL